MKTDPNVVPEALGVLKHLWLFCKSSAEKADENMRFADPEKRPTPDEWRFGRDLYLEVASRIKSQVQEVFGVDISKHESKPNSANRGTVSMRSVTATIAAIEEYVKAYRTAKALEKELLKQGIRFSVEE